MKLLMHVLKKNNKLKIDNENIGPVDIIMKLKEEYLSLIHIYPILLQAL